MRLQMSGRTSYVFSSQVEQKACKILDSGCASLCWDTEVWSLSQLVSELIPPPPPSRSTGRHQLQDAGLQTGSEAEMSRSKPLKIKVTLTCRQKSVAVHADKT